VRRATLSTLRLQINCNVDRVHVPIGMSSASKVRELADHADRERANDERSFNEEPRGHHDAAERNRVTRRASASRCPVIRLVSRGG